MSDRTGAAGGPGECALVVSALGSRQVLEYPQSDGGKRAHYLLRWVNTRGQQGPWSQTVSATVAG